MPQLNPGGKFVFGKSLVRSSGEVRIPPIAVREYDITAEGRVYLFTGSKSTGGFCVTRRGLLTASKLSHILTENPSLQNYSAPEGTFLPYKGRSYCWTSISPDGRIALTEEMLAFLHLSMGMELLSIRSSNIAFTMGAKGQLLEREKNYNGEIPVY